MGEINEFCRKASDWLELASPRELWCVMRDGDLDIRVGMPGVAPKVGALSGPGSFWDILLTRSWAAPAEDLIRSENDSALQKWFEGDHAAQAAAVWEVYFEISEFLTDCGDWAEDDAPEPATEPPPPSPG